MISRLKTFIFDHLDTFVVRAEPPSARNQNQIVLADNNQNKIFRTYSNAMSHLTSRHQKQKRLANFITLNTYLHHQTYWLSLACLIHQSSFVFCLFYGVSVCSRFCCCLPSGSGKRLPSFGRLLLSQILRILTAISLSSPLPSRIPSNYVTSESSRSRG